MSDISQLGLLFQYERFFHSSHHLDVVSEARRNLKFGLVPPKQKQKNGPTRGTQLK